MSLCQRDLARNVEKIFHHDLQIWRLSRLLKLQIL
jgi:hypothetical protein